MNVIPRVVVVAGCLLSASLNAQTLPFTNPTSITVQGAFKNASGESASSALIIDNQLDDGYAAGSDLYFAPDTLLPTASLGNAFFQWGTASSPEDHSSALWFQRLYSSNVGPETVFNLGYLYFRNGTIDSGSGVSDFDLEFALARPSISLPYNLNPIYTTYGASILDTPDTGTTAANADAVVLQDRFFKTNYVDAEGNPYYIKIAFANATGDGSLATPGVFSVTEGNAGRATVTGVFTTVPEPSAAVLGALGSAFLLRRRRNG